MKSVQCTKRLVHLMQALRQDGTRTAVGHHPTTSERGNWRKATAAVLHTGTFSEENRVVPLINLGGLKDWFSEQWDKRRKTLYLMHERNDTTQRVYNTHTLPLPVACQHQARPGITACRAPNLTVAAPNTRPNLGHCLLPIEH